MKIAFPIIQADTGSDVYYRVLTEELRKNNIQADIIKIPRRHEITPWLSKRIKNKLSQYDIIHSNAEYAYLFKSCNKPLISTLHHDVFDPKYYPFTSIAQKTYYNWLLKKNINKSFHSSQMIICPSNTTKKQAKITYPLHLDKFHTIYNGINCENYQEIVPSNRTKNLLLFVGSPIVRKGFDTLPALMKILDKHKLICICRESSKFKNSHNIEYKSDLTKTQLIELYQEAEFLIAPSRLEGFGYAALEAAMCGCSVITNQNNAITEILSSYNKLLINSNNDPEETSKIILKNSDLIRRTGILQKEYTASIMAKNYISIYQDELTNFSIISKKK